MGYVQELALHACYCSRSQQAIKSATHENTNLQFDSRRYSDDIRKFSATIQQARRCTSTEEHLR